VPESRAELKWLKNVGDNIRRERVAKGLTQARLAELADLNIRNLQRIEAGEFSVLLSTFNRIRKGLGCSWEQLVPES